MTSPLEQLSLDVARVPQLNLEQYLGLWSIEEMFFRQQWELLGRVDLLQHIQSGVVRQEAAKTSLPSVSGDGPQIVQIAIRGTMTKSGSSMSDAGSTVRVRQEVRAARRDPSVDAVLFVADTPGGTVAGTAELAQDIWELTQEKPTATFAEDLMASAGLMAFSQVRKVYANTSGAIVGSMGTYFGMYDRSGEAAQKGIIPVLIRTGDLKGSAFDGLAISDAVKSMWQDVVNANQATFAQFVQRSRNPKTEQMKELSRGGVFSAEAAIGMGLIDGIRSYEAVVAELRSMVPRKKGSKTMSDATTQEKPRPASVAELKAACDGADHAFLVEQLEAEATVETAQRAWSRKQATMILDLQQKLSASQDETKTAKAAHETEVAKLKADHTAELAKAVKASGGKFAPLAETNAGKAASAEGESASAASKWHARKKEVVERGQAADLPSAAQWLAAHEPDLHQAYVAEINAKV